MTETARERLVEILRVPIYPHEQADPTEVVVDYLLDNDVVQVIRCKECLYGVDETESEYYLCNRKMLGKVRHDDFCSYGERRTDGTDQ